MEINKFDDKEHYEKVEKAVGSDPKIALLWKKFCSIVEKEKIVTVKYEKIL